MNIWKATAVNTLIMALAVGVLIGIGQYIEYREQYKNYGYDDAGNYTKLGGLRPKPKYRQDALRQAEIDSVGEENEY